MWLCGQTKNLLLNMDKNQFSLVEGPISNSTIQAWIEEVSKDHNLGAQAFFAGQVRSDIRQGKQVRFITYTAYSDMALTVAANICNDMTEKYGPLNIKVLHSLGNVATGELSLLVMVAGKHRKEAMEACRDIVERIKKDLPVWGKEWLEDQGSEWKLNS